MLFRSLAERKPTAVTLLRRREYGSRQMPDVHGMGARDAVYLIESRGVKCVIRGRGRVTAQSIAPGSKISKGQRCVLTLE